MIALSHILLLLHMNRCAFRWET